MIWKDILKAPMPIDTRGNRDEQYRQKVVEYEKSRIEPALKEYYSNNKASENSPFSIFIGSQGVSESGFHIFDTVGPAYRISRNDLDSMGGNKQFVIGVIKDLYEKEGYQVDMKPNNEGIIITQ